MTDTVEAWDAGADVVIAGASVLVLEKAARVGGKTAIAIGSFTASETAMQRAAGISDSHADHLADMTALAEQRKPEEKTSSAK